MATRGKACKFWRGANEAQSRSPKDRAGFIEFTQTFVYKEIHLGVYSRPANFGPKRRTRTVWTDQNRTCCVDLCSNAMQRKKLISFEYMGRISIVNDDRTVDLVVENDRLIRVRSNCESLRLSFFNRSCTLVLISLICASFPLRC